MSQGHTEKSMDGLSLAVSEKKQIHPIFILPFWQGKSPAVNGRDISHASPSPGIAAPPSPSAPHTPHSSGGVSAHCPPVPQPPGTSAASEGVPHRLLCLPLNSLACPPATRARSNSRKEGGRGKSSSCIHRVSVRNRGFTNPFSHPAALPCLWEKSFLPTVASKQSFR